MLADTFRMANDFKKSVSSGGGARDRECRDFVCIWYSATLQITHFDCVIPHHCRSQSQTLSAVRGKYESHITTPPKPFRSPLQMKNRYIQKVIEDALHLFYLGSLVLTVNKNSAEMEKCIVSMLVKDFTHAFVFYPDIVQRGGTQTLEVPVTHAEVHHFADVRRKVGCAQMG